MEVWSVMVKSVQWQLVEDGVSKPRLCFGEMSRAQAGGGECSVEGGGSSVDVPGG